MAGEVPKLCPAHLLGAWKSSVGTPARRGCCRAGSARGFWSSYSTSLGTNTRMSVFRSFIFGSRVTAVRFHEHRNEFPTVAFIPV